MIKIFKYVLQKRFKINLNFLLTVFLTVACWKPVSAADIFETGPCFLSGKMLRTQPCDRMGYWTGSIVIRGEIKRGDDRAFVAVLDKMTGYLSQVILRSEGGDISTAMEIGKIVRNLKADTFGPSLSDKNIVSCDEVTEAKRYKDNKAANCICASACFLIYSAGYFRDMSGIEIHRAFLERSQNAKLFEDNAVAISNQIDTQLKSYLDSMGIPPQYISLMLKTPSTNSQRLTYNQMRDDIVGYSKAVEEWMYAKCNLPPESDIIKLSDQKGAQLAWSSTFKARMCAIEETRKLQELAFRDWRKARLNLGR